MSDWLERGLSQGLAPTVAPGALGVRLGFAAAKRREFPRLRLALALAVVLAIGAGYAGGRSPALDLRQAVARALRGPRTHKFVSNDPVVVAAWLRREADLDVPRRCEGGTGGRFPLAAGKATVLLAHAAPPAEVRPAAFRPEHAALEAACQSCHSL